MISPTLSQVPLPLPIDEEYLSTTQEGRQPDGVPSRIDMIIFSSKLVDLLGNMRAAVRAPHLKIKQSGAEFLVPDPTALLQVNSQIDDLVDRLPPHLRPNADYSKMPCVSDEDVQCFQAQSQAIRFRLLIIRVFLLRPSLLAEAQRWTTRDSVVPHTASSVLQERFHQEICLLCLKTVHAVLEEIHSGLSTTLGMSTWYSLHCKRILASLLLYHTADPVDTTTVTFAAATILLVSTLSPLLANSLDTEPTKTSWERAMAILEFHRAHISSAGRSIEVLQRYRHSITRRASSGSRKLLSFHIPTSQFATANDESLLAGSSTGAQGVPSGVFQPPAYPQHGQLGQGQQGQHGQAQQFYAQAAPTWEPTHAIPTPPAGGMEGGLQEYLASESLNEAWLTTQDFGQGDWVLHHSYS
jgi:hypothetical protein